MGKMEEEALNFIEDMTLNNYKWSSEGKFDVDALTLLTARMDAMIQNLDRLNVSAVNLCAPSPSYDRCGSIDYVTKNCQVGDPFAPSPIEHVAYVNNFQPRLTHITLILIPIILVGSTTRTFLIKLSLYLSLD